MNRAERRRWRDDISRILATFTPDDPRDLIVWALGAHQESHAVSVWQLLHGMFTATAGGSTLTTPGVRYLDYGSREVCIKTLADHNAPALIVATWREVADALHVGPALVAELKAALTDRRELVGRRMDAPWGRTMRCPVEHEAARDALDQEWYAIERRCEDLGAQAWEGCRPAAVPEPADLLELLASMGVAA